MDGVGGFSEPQPAGSYSVYGTSFVKMLFLKYAYPFLITLLKDFVFHGGKRGRCLINQQTAWKQELIVSPGEQWLSISINTKYPLAFQLTMLTMLLFTNRAQSADQEQDSRVRGGCVWQPSLYGGLRSLGISPAVA